MSTCVIQAALSSALYQPPAMLEVGEEADVHPAYAECISFCEDDVLIAPSPEAGQPGVWRVAAEMRDIRPHAGDLLQSMLAGEDVDVKGGLTHFRDAVSQDRKSVV